MTYQGFQLNNLIELLSSPAGLVALLMAVVIGALVIALSPLKWWVVTLVLYTATFGYQAWVQTELVFPLNYWRTYARSLCVLGLMMLVVPTLTADTGWRKRCILGAAGLFFFLQLIFSFRAGLGGDYQRLIFGTISYALTFFVLGWGMSRWLKKPGDAINAVRTIAVPGALFVLGTLLQYFVQPEGVAWAGRLFGTSGNANHAAASLATAFPPICFLLTRPGKKIYRGMIALAAASAAVMMMWTGSRTGMVMCLVGVVLLFRTRVLSFLVAGIIVALMAMTLLRVFTDAGAMAERLVTLDNTRSGGWQGMLMDFFSHPLLGINAEDASASESSYLLIAAHTGIVGVIPMIAMMILTARSLWSLHRQRQWLGEHKLLGDLVIAGICSIGAGAFFEGFMFALYNISVYALYIYFAILAFLLDYAEEQQAQALYAEGYENVEYEQELVGV